MDADANVEAVATRKAVVKRYRCNEMRLNESSSLAKRSCR